MARSAAASRRRVAATWSLCYHPPLPWPRPAAVIVTEPICFTVCSSCSRAVTDIRASRVTIESGQHSVPDHGPRVTGRDHRCRGDGDLSVLLVARARRVRVVCRRFANGLRVPAVSSTRLARRRL